MRFTPISLSSLVTISNLLSIAHASSASTTTSPTINDECSNPRPNDCQFYAQCLESRYHCGPSGYPIGYGQKYCEKFQSNRNKLSVEGQQWMETVMLCLQRDLVPFADGSKSKNSDNTNTGNTTCAELKDYAFSTHPGCYVRSGVCTLPVSDWEAIVDIVGLSTLFDSMDALKATIEAVGGCGEFYLWLVEKDLF